MLDDLKELNIKQVIRENNYSNYSLNKYNITNTCQ